MKKPFILAVFFSLFCLSLFSQDLMVRSGEKGIYLEHLVAPKEGLYSIGRLYNVNPKTIAAYNSIDLNGGLNLGQSLRIPLNDTNFTQKTGKGFPVYYEPAAGEGLMKVSNANRKVSLANLRSWNKLSGDNVKAGQKLIVGFLVSKDFNPSAIAKTNTGSESGTSGASPTGQAGGQDKNVVTKTSMPKADNNTQVVITNFDSTRRKDQVVTQTFEQPKKKDNEPVVVSTEPKKETIKPETAKPQPVDRPVADPTNAAPEEVRLSSEDGFFKSFFDQQIKTSPVSRNTTVTAGIFKTSSGWQDSKYYLLIDGVATGTIVRLINPDNNKAVYAKVLGEMNGIRQNQGLGVRISNAAAAALGVKEEDKFILRVNY